MSKKVLVVAATLLLAGCAQQGYGQKESVGTLLGAVGGAVVGAQFGSGTGQLAAVAAGTLLGAFLGNEAGKSLDRADIVYANRTHHQVLESYPIGRTGSWHNPDTGHYGTVTPTKTYQTNGNYCREYQTTVTVGGKTQQAYGNACRMPDGQWKIMN